MEAGDSIVQKGAGFLQGLARPLFQRKDNMKREIKFYNGYDCIKFECVNGKDSCHPGSGGSHGVHGLEIGFYVYGDCGVVQFRLSTGWLPQKVEKNKIGHLEFKASFKALSDLFPIPTDLGYHAYKPQYEGQTSRSTCKFLGGKECYYDGSILNANDAFYTLLNGGEEKLFEFLEQYYLCVFENGEYPQVYEYPKQQRKGTHVT